MIMNEFILKLEDLPILLNLLYHTGNEQFKLYSYIVGKELFSVSLEDEVKVKRLINREDYEKAIENIYEFHNIVPQFETLRTILIGSGILKMGNWEKLLNIFDEIKKRNPLCGDRIAVIGFDTNCFIHRIYSCIKQIIKLDISKFGFVLSKIIHNELSSMEKIKKKELNDFINKLNRDAEIFTKFWNQDALSTRLKHIGLVEYYKLRNQAIYIINDNLKQDDRDSDFQIIEDLRTQTSQRNYDLFLFSSDNQFYDRARSPGVYSHYLKIPPLEQMSDEFSAKWEQICDFLYLISVHYGAISLQAKNKKIQLLGIWTGKDSSEWDSESIKLKIGSQSFSNLLQQQLNILFSE